MFKILAAVSITNHFLTRKLGIVRNYFVLLRLFLAQNNLLWVGVKEKKRKSPDVTALSDGIAQPHIRAIFFFLSEWLVTNLRGGGGGGSAFINKYTGFLSSACYYTLADVAKRHLQLLCLGTTATRIPDVVPLKFCILRSSMWIDIILLRVMVSTETNLFMVSGSPSHP